MSCAKPQRASPVNCERRQNDLTSRYFQLGLIVSIVAIAVAMALMAIDNGRGSKDESALSPITREMAPKDASGIQKSESEKDTNPSFRTLRQNRVIGGD